MIIEMYVVLTCPTMQLPWNRLVLYLDSLDITSNGDEFANTIEAPVETVLALRGRSDMRNQSALVSALALGTGMFAALLYLS